jgi:O-acetyl-ADP-ribose deacetylase (regulator of RNase III)
VRIEFDLGDITLQRVDAIVNAANSSLLGGGGVDGAIHRAGGPSILAECAELRRTTYQSGLPTGQAVATTGGALPARWVIHTVGPVYSPLKDQAPLLASCYRESLRVAVELGATSIAFPAISTGVYGYPVPAAAAVAVGAVLEERDRGGETATSIDLVRFVLFSQGALDVFEAAFRDAT